MEIYQLRCFYEVAREQNISRTAARLKITQPALSKTINRLEDDLGVKLFDRKSKAITLNEYGRAVYDKAEEIFAAIDDIRLNIDDIKNGNVGSIRIGSTLPSSESSWLLDCIKDFIFLNPKVSINQRQMQPGELKKAIQENTVDIAIGGKFLADSEFDHTLLYRNQLGIIASAQSRFNGLEEISITDLKNETFFCNNSNTDMEDLTYEICEKAGFVPHIALCSNYSNMIGELIFADKGISIIPVQVYNAGRKFGEIPSSNKVIMLPLKEAFCVQDEIAAISKSHYVRNSARLLYKAILEHAEALK